jgi:hypothetical protein
MMRLVEQGKVDLNAPVKRYLPDFKVQDEGTTNNVAIWHLLTHTPGWEGQLNAADRGSLTLANFIDSMRDLPKLADRAKCGATMPASTSRAASSKWSLASRFMTRSVRWCSSPSVHARLHANREPRHVSLLLRIVVIPDR